MSITMFHRVLRRKTIAFFLCGLLILIFTSDPEAASLADILGGIPGQEASRQIDVVGMLRWNLCVFPPITVSVLFFREELMVFKYLSLIRFQSAKQWMRSSIVTIVFINYIYLVTFFIVIFCRSFRQGFITALLIETVLIFPIHTLMISMVSIAIYLIAKNIRIILIAFLMIEGVGVALGTTISAVEKYMLALYGMSQRINWKSNSGGTVWFPIVIMATVAFISGMVITHQVKRGID